MKKNTGIQYTLRGVPRAIDRTLREQAVKEGKSINHAALAALERGLGVSSQKVVHDDMDDLIGSWEPDPVFDKAIKGFRTIDRDLWK